MLAATLASTSVGWRRPVRFASAQLLPAASRSLLRGSVSADVLDLHDHPRLQTEALGLPLTAGRRRELDELFAANVEQFARLVVPSESFIKLCDLPPDRVVVVTNGTDPDRIVPRQPPAEPVIGMVSGAAPGRGIEMLLDAVARVRIEIPEASLRLALTATGPASSSYLRSLVERIGRDEPSAAVQAVPGRELGAFLGSAAVLVVPHPPGPYLDVATPVKLFDSMAAGRPLAVTPRLETRRIVEACDAGVVARGDTADDLADAILTLLRSEPLRRRLGANARRCAVERYDWRLLSAQLADAILGPTGSSGSGNQNASR